MVPKKGLEPPHPCGYMDLNHARLPIPPLRRVDASQRCDLRSGSMIIVKAGVSNWQLAGWLFAGRYSPFAFRQNRRIGNPALRQLVLAYRILPIPVTEEHT